MLAIPLISNVVIFLNIQIDQRLKLRYIDLTYIYKNEQWRVRYFKNIDVRFQKASIDLIIRKILIHFFQLDFYS